MSQNMHWDVHVERCYVGPSRWLDNVDNELQHRQPLRPTIVEHVRRVSGNWACITFSSSLPVVIRLDVSHPH
jgi:hypothetical protein